jgi:hypothetical protein
MIVIGYRSESRVTDELLLVRDSFYAPIPTDEQELVPTGSRG